MGPDPAILRPLPQAPSVVFLAPLAKGRNNVAAGRFSYYDDPEDPESFFDQNVRYHFEFVGDRLEIGDFCAIATGAQFIMNGATHALGGFSTFPFNIFGGGWEDGFDPDSWSRENKGDTVVGPDVWIGAEAVILPGVKIGAGAIIAARSVVSRDVPPFSVVAGNPAQIVRTRFEECVVERLLHLAWWDWPVDKISRNLSAIRGAAIDALEAAA